MNRMESEHLQLKSLDTKETRTLADDSFYSMVLIWAYKEMCLYLVIWHFRILRIIIKFEY